MSMSFKDDRLAFVFPGQGSQYVGMGKDLLEKFAVKDFYERASEILGFEIKELMLSGPEERLMLTENAQPAIFLDSVVKFHILAEVLKIKPAIAAGHSLGEYSALVSSGVITLEDGLRLIRYRGKLMQEAAPRGEGAMVAIIGLEYEKINQICEKIKGVVEVANYNSPNQIVISGQKEAVHKAANKAREAGAKTIELRVSGPFHSSLMRPAQEKLAEMIGKVSFKRPAFPVISTVSGEPEKNPLRIKRLLIKQATSPVRWVDYMKRIAQLGIKKTIEVGPGNVLKKLNQQILPQLEHLEFKEAVEGR